LEWAERTDQEKVTQIKLYRRGGNGQKMVYPEQNLNLKRTFNLHDTPKI